MSDLKRFVLAAMIVAAPAIILAPASLYGQICGECGPGGDACLAGCPAGDPDCEKDNCWDDGEETSCLEQAGCGENFVLTSEGVILGGPAAMRTFDGLSAALAAGSFIMEEQPNRVVIRSACDGRIVLAWYLSGHPADSKGVALDS